jgi:hypothetical protein
MKLSRFTFVWCVLAGATPAAVQGAAASNVVAPRIEAIARKGFSATDPALLLVYVVDQDGDPLADVEVRLTGTKTPTVPLKTGKDGTLLMRISESGRVTVRALQEGAVTAKARQVAVKPGGLTVVALPMQPVADEP